MDVFLAYMGFTQLSLYRGFEFLKVKSLFVSKWSGCNQFKIVPNAPMFALRLSFKVYSSGMTMDTQNKSESVKNIRLILDKLWFWQGNAITTAGR